MEIADLVVINKADIDAIAATREQLQITSALQPKNAAERAMAPRLCGLPMPSRMGSTGAAHRMGGSALVSNMVTPRGAATATMPP